MLFVLALRESRNFIAGALYVCVCVRDGVGWQPLAFPEAPANHAAMQPAGHRCRMGWHTLSTLYGSGNQRRPHEKIGKWIIRMRTGRDFNMIKGYLTRAVCGSQVSL
jgi:hypothetical protein